MSKNGRNITDFFKPFTIPKNRIPRQDEDDEIIVASSSSSRANTRDTTRSPVKKQPSRPPPAPRTQQSHDVPTPKRGRGRPRKDDPTAPSKVKQEIESLERTGLGVSTPTRRSPRKHMAGMDGEQEMPPDSSGLTSVQTDLKATPSTVRTLKAVEIPSPVRNSSPKLPTQIQMPAPESKNAANISFSSFSTLTSMSGMSSQSSSRRIVKNGIPAVTNSDSASMSSSSSDDELVDLEDFAPRKKRKLSPPAPEQAAELGESKPTRSSTRLGGASVKSRAFDTWRPLSPPPTTTYKHSLLNISKQRAREAASAKRIAEAEAYVQEAERVQEPTDTVPVEGSQSRSVAKAFAQDSDEEERMIMAMDRTEALRREETFFFFCNAMEEKTDTFCPTEDLEACGLAFLSDQTKLQRACTSGYLTLVASQKGLPARLVTWIHEQILQESSPELCDSYVAIIDALVAGEHDLPDLAFSLSETHAGQTFRDLEASRISDSSAVLPVNLRHTLKAMAVLAPRTSPSDQACALAELILLNNDENVRSDMDVRFHIESTMSAILESNTDASFEIVLRETTRQIVHASSISRHLLSRAIASLPATTLRLHRLRRTIALHIVLDAPLDEDIDVTSQSTGVRLTLRMKKHPSFQISETTDYVALHSLCDLLDVAIDVGFSDFAFLDQQALQPNEIAEKNTGLFSSTPTPRNPEETSFNSQVDGIASQLRLMSSKIRDAGTSHLKRTEAKSALERLIVRLDCSVRTKSRAKKGIFDRSSIGNMSAGALEGFLRRAESGNGKSGRDAPASESEGKDSESEERNESVQGAPGKQHKVTWRDDVVGMGDVAAGAEESDDSM